MANYPTYVIFFCNFDYYRRGLVRYQFEFRDKWHPEIAAGDLRTLVVFNTKAKDYQHADMIQGTVDTNDKFIAAVDAEVQEIRADKQREARFMKEQIELRRQLRKSREAERNKNTLGLIKALEKRGTPTPEIVAMIADAQSISQAEAQKYYDQLVVVS
ncbi:hypothetical protein [Limosilactobacillus ingluviei]|uniref:hypothetical protein n=1 Tax=Limosilactobacillus ingluviei TaxID=148604 RepID=UPI0024B8D46E|nr:hypothetical protein [Limosilactobacillus ingluviei]